MTKKDIVRLAQEVWSADDAYSAESLHRFAALVAAAEREAICELLMRRTLDALPLIDAIRARGESK
jgi:hypothetical protein